MSEGISVTEIPLPGGALQRLPPVTSPDHPDAALIALCSAFDTLERTAQSSHVGPVEVTESDAAEAERTRLHDEQASDPGVRLYHPGPHDRGATGESVRSLCLWDEFAIHREPICIHDRLRTSLLTDLLAMSGRCAVTGAGRLEGEGALPSLSRCGDGWRALRCYAAGRRGYVRKCSLNTKPAWLAKLRPLERKQAERWMREAGEPGFMAIARIAASFSRAPNAPKKDNDGLVIAALVHWLKNPSLDKKQVPKQFASLVKENSLLGSRYSAIEIGTIEDYIRDGIKNPVGSLVFKAEAQATRLGLAVMFGNGGRPVIIKVPPNRYRYTMPPQYQEFSRRIADSMRQFESRLTTPTAAMSPDHIDRVQRIGSVLRAMEGLIPEEIPVSRITALFDDMVALLNKEPD